MFKLTCMYQEAEGQYDHGDWDQVCVCFIYVISWKKISKRLLNRDDVVLSLFVLYI